MDQPNNNDIAEILGDRDDDAAVDAAAFDNDDDDDDGIFDPATTEQIRTGALSILQNRVNFPSRLRDRSIIRFAHQFITKVDAVVYDDDDDDQDDNNEDNADTDDDDDDDDGQDDHDVMHAEDEDEDEDDIFDPNEMEQICTEAMSLLQDRLDFFSLSCDQTMVRFAQQFITNVKDDIHKTITDTRLEEEGYDGLDSERDTEEEVATAIRCCPEVLTQRDERFGYYPITCLSYMQEISDDYGIIRRNTKAVSFIHLFVQLAIEFNSFQDEERGGLLIEGHHGNNVLHYLVFSTDEVSNENHHQLVDTTSLAVLIRLRQSGYFVQDDIQQYRLVHTLCHYDFCLEQRLHFLIEWDPSSLLQTNVNNTLPLGWAQDNLRLFQVLFDAYIRYYPKVRGLNVLFQRNDFGITPFELVCNNLTHTKVLEVVEEIIARYTTNGLCNTNNGNALMLAASDDTISLDGVYFIMRRQPDTMINMLVRNPRHDEEKRSTTILSSSSFKNNTNNNNKNNEPSSDRNTTSDEGTDNDTTNNTDDNIVSNTNANTNLSINNSTNNSSSNNTMVLRSNARKRKRN